MHFCQSCIILAITTCLFLVLNRVNGKLLKMNIASSRDDQFDRIHHDLTKIKIPKKFDAREKWHFCKSLHHIKNQGKCRGSWAFATSSVMADRLCIQSNGEIDVSLSEQDLMECCRSCYENKKIYESCGIGDVMKAFKFWKWHGVVTGDNGCKPKSEGITEGIPVTECRLRCTNEKYPLKYKDDKKFGLRLFFQEYAKDPDIKHIFAEIMINGPVVGSMDTYKYVKDKEYSPPKGIIVYNKNLIEIDEELVIVAVKIIGWDEIDGIPVWIIANSWGEDWCKKGFCYVKRGDFGIEDHLIITGLAGFSKINKKLEDDNPSKENKTQTSGSDFLKMTNPMEVLVILCIFRI